jgi:uncharacterized membrane protein HdeD (DUF308 family)
MKILQSSFFRSLCAVIIGVLLLMHPNSTLKGITIAIGVLFLLSGVISCVVYLVARSQAAKVNASADDGADNYAEKPLFPIVGVGSVILGFILALMPETFVQWLMYVLGAMVILGAVSQFVALITARKFWKMSGFYWVLPSLLLLTGLFVILYPIETAATPLVIIGIALVVYGLSEAINSFMIYRQHRAYMKSQTIVEVEEVELLENKSE